MGEIGGNWGGGKEKVDAFSSTAPDRMDRRGRENQVGISLFAPGWGRSLAAHSCGVQDLVAPWAVCGSGTLAPGAAAGACPPANPPAPASSTSTPALPARRYPR